MASRNPVPVRTLAQAAPPAVPRAQVAQAATQRQASPAAQSGAILPPDEFMDDVHKADTGFNRLPKMNPGHEYQLQVDSIEYKHTRMDRKHLCFFAFTVLSSTDSSLPAGRKVGWSKDMANQLSWPPNAKAFFLAAIGQDPMDKSDENNDLAEKNFKRFINNSIAVSHDPSLLEKPEIAEEHLIGASLKVRVDIAQNKQGQDYLRLTWAPDYGDAYTI